MVLLWVKGFLEMMESHRAPSSLDMGHMDPFQIKFHYVYKKNVLVLIHDLVQVLVQDLVQRQESLIS